MTSFDLNRAGRLRPFVACALFASFFLTTAPAPAQLGPPPSQQTGDSAVDFEVDLEALLTAPEVMSDQAEGPVWTLDAGSGKRLIQLPVILKPGPGPVEIRSSSIGISGGRLVAYRLVPPEVSGNDRELAEDNRAELISNLPASTPHFARDFILQPDGSLDWKLERFIYGGKAGGDSLYALKIDSELLRSKHPGEPPRNTRENAGEIADYRQKRDQYFDLRRQINALPTEFSMPMPERIWAIYELSGFKDELIVEGSDPLPWSISLARLQTLRQAADAQVKGGNQGRGNNQGNTDGLSPAYNAAFNQLAQMLSSDRHPYTMRLAANLIAHGKLAKHAGQGDTLYQIMQLIIQSEQTDTRNIVVKELVTTIPPTAATSSLLRMAAQNLDPTLQLMSLEGLIKGEDELTPIRLQEIVTTAGRMLADPAGPPVGLLLDELEVVLEKQADALPLLINGLRFSGLPDQRRDEAIVYVLESAADSTLAAGWLDRQMLGGTDQELVRRTLEILSSADTGMAGLRPVVGTLLSAVFGRATQEDGQEQAAQAVPTIDRRIPIDSPRHAMLRVLQSGDRRMREISWRVLPLFEINPSDDLTALQRNQALRDTYNALLDAALAQSPVPVQAADFFQRQAHPELSGGALARLLIRANGQASVRASRALLGSKLPLDQVILSQTYGDRYGFGVRMYENLQGAAPVSVGLLRHRDDEAPAAIWFGRQVAAGELPETQRWVEAFDNEDKLLEMATASDPQLALGAVGALVAAAGGDSRIAEQITKNIRSLPDPSLEAVRGKWRQEQRSIYIEQMRQAQGPYRMILKVHDPKQVDRFGSTDADTATTLGVIELRAAADVISFGNQNITLTLPEDKLAIRIEKPSELKNLSHQALVDLPLEGLNKALELLPESDGGWHGEARLPDGRLMELELKPADAS